jgi:hypothetical protein
MAVPVHGRDRLIGPSEPLIGSLPMILEALFVASPHHLFRCIFQW